ncbi:MAG: cyclodeaminase/cyclohydrolase family protein [Gaiellaceae bacterium]
MLGPEEGTLDLASVVGELGSPGNASAAGAAAALVGALAAAVAAKVGRSSAFAADAAQAVALSERLLRLAPADAHAFATARTALGTAGDRGDARADFLLGRALEQAAAVPLEIAECCADVAVLAGQLASTAEPAFQPDAAAAALLAAAAAAAASLLVEANLAVSPGDERAARARAAAEAATAATA